MIFSLDYGTLRQTLQKMRYTGTVKASVPEGTFTGGTVFLQFQNGVVHNAVVVLKDGRQVNNPALIDEQLAYGTLLDWYVAMPSLTDSSGDERGSVQTNSMSFEPSEPIVPVSPSQQEPHTFSNTTTSPSSLYPRRLPANPEWIRTWPVMHRHVYNLSTGEYSEQDIARLLRYPFADLLNILSDLERMEVIQRGK